MISTMFMPTFSDGEFAATAGPSSVENRAFTVYDVLSEVRNKMRPLCFDRQVRAGGLSFFTLPDKRTSRNTISFINFRRARQINTPTP
jgi:hypothetical protein